MRESPSFRQDGVLPRPLDPSEGPLSQAPESIAHYRIVRRIGSGGMGEVYLAEDTRLGRQVAIKLLPTGEALDPAAKKRLLREAQAAARLDHPNLCAIHEVGESASGSYIVMQFVEGHTLSEWMKSHRPTLEQILDFGIQVADALGEAHRHGLIHRDIKPANLMVTTRGQMKVLDFGLAKEVNGPVDGSGPGSGFGESKTLLTTPGMVVGTVPYMSPEQVKGDTLDGRSDLFSLGSVLFEMSTGNRPFQAKSGAELMSAILVFEPPFLDDESSEIHPGLRRILRRALAKLPDDRYATAQDMVVDLKELRRTLSKEALAAIAPALTAPGQFPSQPRLSQPSGRVSAARSRYDSSDTVAARPMAKSHRTRAWAAAGLALMLAGAGVSAFLWARDRDTVDSIAVLPFVNASNNPEMDYLSDGLTESLINQLSHLPHLRVIARTSVLRYKGKEPDLRAIAKELGVKAVVVGRIQARQDQVSISWELADASENRHLGGDNMTRPAAELLNLQDSLAQEISQHLGRQLSPEEQGNLAQGKIQTDPEAYQFYLKGRFYQDQWTPEGFQKAMSFYDQALAKDPTFALAQAQKAMAIWNQCSLSISPAEGMPRVRTEAEKALRLDPKNAEAYAALGGVKAVYDYDFPGAEASFRKALELNPHSETALEYFGYILTAEGKAKEAIEVLNRAGETDPMSPVRETFLGMAYMWGSRDYQQGAGHFQRANSLDPEFWWPRLFHAWCLDQLGDAAGADAELEIAKKSGASYVLGYLASRAAHAGRQAEARKILNDLQAKPSTQDVYNSPRAIAMVYVALGEKAEAIRWLQKGYEVRDEGTIFMHGDPTWDPIRDLPEFRAIESKVFRNP